MGDVGSSAWLVLGLCFWVVITACECAPSPHIEDSSNPQKHVGDTEKMSESSLGRLQRKLLMDDDGSSNINPAGNASNSKISYNTSSSPWPVLVGLLLSVLSVALVIALVVKFRIVQRFFGGYNEALLPEGDTASQFSQPGTLTANFPAHSMRDRQEYGGSQDEDDDGFIEDNYIVAGAKERAEREVVHEEVTDEESDDELDIHFSID
ncbi:uncharacterized protein LOC108430696 isoform X1 [Pygocentrus nattereri]|uniref:uncharacterized protein LOC108430696 isoform X1 n=2 Tax=Pygocentrus nattereri TaxID=42514 RepID=UPI0008145132|nr:uncharacterized protein LOC108430696 isoform X1 [Pygocentrus nattereri]